MDRFLEIAGLITRWFMAALACWWFFWFITLIGASSDNAQYLAGTALMKAIICGGAAGIWFYKARTAKAAKSLREYSLRSQQPVPTVSPRVIPALEPHQDTQLAAVVNAPQKASEPQGTTKMICGGCGKESADEFNFCPHCGKALVLRPSVIESPSPSPEDQPVADAPTDESEPIRDGVAGTAIRFGTLVFGAFSAISLLVSIVKGVVPIYLLEAAGWAGVAWYWQGKKTHSDFAKAIVIVLAVLVALGEVLQIGSEFKSESKQTLAGTPNPFDSAFVSQSPSTYQSPPAPTGAATQQDKGPILKQKIRAPATLLVMCDLACTWKLDGEAKGRIDAGGSAKAKVEFGQHEVVGTTEDGLDKVESDIEVKDAGQSILHVVLKPVRDTRLQAEQEARARVEKEVRDKAEQEARDNAAQEEREKELERQAQEQAALVEPTRKYNEGVTLYNQKRYKEAAPLLMSACDGGVAAGCATLGGLYDSGHGVSQNYTQARSLYERACEGGEMVACNNLGWLYDKGHGVPRNYAQARFYYERACDSGEMSSCNNLAFLYYYGRGVPADYTKARALLTKACEGGEEAACEGLRMQQ